MGQSKKKYERTCVIDFSFPRPVQVVLHKQRTVICLTCRLYTTKIQGCGSCLQRSALFLEGGS
jgi:hypothetical protein